MNELADQGGTYRYQLAFILKEKHLELLSMSDILTNEFSYIRNQDLHTHPNDDVTLQA
jgi:hypothetical protein